MFHILVFSFFYCNSQKNLQFFVTPKIIPILLYSNSTYNSKSLYLKPANSYWIFKLYLHFRKKRNRVKSEYIVILVRYLKNLVRLDTPNTTTSR